MGARARLITTSLTAAVTVSAVVVMADVESTDVDPLGEAAGGLAASFGDAWVAEESMAAPEPVEGSITEPVRVPARLKIRVSG
ncbi:MAG: hypothetical protein HOH36_17215 [Acidimicrobiaceae bacterium]|nr:hypothetical protein [Acidimicrobiaceae bacterium]